ncbi:serine/threonine protein kinase [Thermacetogenium phaeum DSM 12270]|uniref:Serine/threonine protein kinase n=1 Tax=Thermacetogenium phaeum (strain ATCC BAA-254 / DSM 26808 / PB) TaxID=1089553 RepID=K4LIL5_THEPS|nr:protein kinase [Thermacetogenium phaeum]AFV11902.1 serine/threonine protein kinase [Thermacetogenium phaeum DSM 12270]
MLEVEDLLNRLRVYKRGAEVNPHKYLFLLTIAVIFEKKPNHKNKFTYDEIEPIYLSYFDIFFPDMEQYKKKLEYPFYHLQSDGIWHLQIKEGKESIYKIYENTRLTKKRLIETVDYGYLDEKLYQLMLIAQERTNFKEKLIDLICKMSSHQYHISSANTTDGKGIIVKEQSSLFKHEQSAISIINSIITNQNIGKLLNNIWIYDNQTNNYYEYDIVLVSRSGIYVVELKHWSGHIRIAPYNWEINGTHYRTDPHKNNSFKCKVLKGIYQHRFKTYPDLWIESVVVFTNPESTVEGANSPGLAAEQNTHNLTFASISDFISYLKRRESLQGHLLEDQQIEAIINYIHKLNTPRQSIKYTVPGYETVEYISQSPECIELVARPINAPARGLHRFRIFRTPAYANAEGKERFLRKAYNTLNAVSQIGDHPHILKVSVIKNEDGDIIEISDWSNTGTLRDLIRRHRGPFPIDEALGICRSIAHALSEAHRLDLIHRAVKPENILMMNDIPKLMNFDLVYQIEDNRITVIPDVSKLKDDGYIAPEVLAGEDIDEGTDYFSLGVIAYEMLTGVKPFASVREFAAQGGVLSKQLLQKLADSGVSARTIETIEGMIVADRVGRLKDADKIIAAFSLDKEEGLKSAEPGNVNPELQSGDQYDVYEIIERIGIGAEAQIYKARTLRGQLVVLKLFNKEIPLERILKEAEISSAINSAYVIHCYDRIGHWKNDRYFIVLEYIEGESLRNKIDRHEGPDIETFRTVALCLMDALEDFHEHRDEEGNPQPLLHSDVKPDNILITKDRKAVLIDCGIAGEPRVDVFQGTVGYVPPDSIRGTDMEFSVGGDLFALGVTLWEWLFGTKPYNNPVIGDKPQIPEALEDDIQRYIPWLLKAVATQASERFATIKEMREAFIECSKLQEEIKPEVEKTEEVGAQLLPVSINPFVAYLNSLSNASAYNENATAESQFGNTYFERIFVNNPLIDYIYEQLVCERNNVILTGNAGDGKTTTAGAIIWKLTGKFQQLKSKEKIDELNLMIVKDMSELPEEERSRVLAEALENKTDSYLIVSNTGTLLESYKKLKIEGMVIDESELLEALEADVPQHILNGCFLVVNIGRMDSIDTACDVFRRMLDPGNWLPNKTCQYRDYCPIYRNVKLLQENLDVVSKRIMLLYRRLYEYNVRLTMRQMTGHLAYAITTGIDCPRIAEMSYTALQDLLLGSLFFNRFFGDDGIDTVPEAMQLLPVRRIREAEFGVVLDPSFERKVWVEGGPPLPLTGEAKNIYQKLADEVAKDGPAARRQMRRLVYFFAKLDEIGEKKYVSNFLRSPMLMRFLEFTAGNEISPLLERSYRYRILQVLQEYFIGARLPEESWQEKDIYITLKRREGSSKTQLILAVLRAEDFALAVKQRYQIGKDRSGIFCLRYRQGDRLAEMNLDLPFLDYVARRYEGDVVEELSANYTDRLERFKGDLMNIYHTGQRPEQDEDRYLRLLRIGPDRTFRVMKIIVSDSSLEVFM